MVDDTVAGVADSALIPPVIAPAVALMPAFAPVADVFTTCFVVFPNKFPNVDPNKESSGVNIFVIYWVPFAKYMNILNPRNANMKIITIQVIQEILLKNPVTVPTVLPAAPVTVLPAVPVPISIPSIIDLGAADPTPTTLLVFPNE